MLYLRNPVGRIVIFDTQDHYNQYVNQGGFSKLTNDEVKEFEVERTAWFEAMRIAKEEEGKPPTGIHFVTVSPGGADGFGVASGVLLRELRKLGINVKTYYDGQKLAVLFHNPYSITSLETPYRIIYTMFESDKIPDDWIDYLQLADRVIVPSHWCQKVFAKSGIQASVVPLGYDPMIFKPVTRPSRRENNDYFTFLHYNAYNARKGFLEVYKAFTSEFAIDEPVRMIFKTTLTNPYQHFPINEEIYRNIEVIAGQVSPFDMQRILARSDCMVFPSRGEGFGVTPLECMATGMPVIVPNAHGISEYFDSAYMYEVKVAGPSPALYSRYKNMDVGQMVTCDIDDLRRRMRWVYEHQDEAMERGKAGIDYARKWTLDRTADVLKKIIDDVLEKPPKQQNMANFLQLEPVK